MTPTPTPTPTCAPGCSPPAGTDGGTARATFVSVFPGSAVGFTVSARVNAEPGAMLNATANISSSVEDPNTANSSATANFRVVELRRGTVWAWGHNFFGQVGDGTNVARTTAVPIDDLSVIDIGAGNNYSIALKSDGTVWTWGSNDQGRLGTGAPPTASVNRPVQISSLSSMTAIAAGTEHVLALKSDGTVWVWGSNTLGELGLGTADFAPHTTPVQVTGFSGIVAIFAGDHVSYAMKADGTVFGWGA